MPNGAGKVFWIVEWIMCCITGAAVVVQLILGVDVAVAAVLAVFAIFTVMNVGIWVVARRW